MKFSILSAAMLALGLVITPVMQPLQAAPTDKEKQVEAILELLSHLEIDNIGDDLFAMMAERTVPTMRASVPNLPEEAYAMLHEELSSAFKRATADLLTSNVRLYLEHLSPEEVNDLNAFYSKPSGKKMLQVIPMLMQQSLYLGQEWIQRLDRDVRQTWTERLKQEGYLKE